MSTFPPSRIESVLAEADAFASGNIPAGRLYHVRGAANRASLAAIVRQLLAENKALREVAA